MRIILVGGSGFLGSAISARLAAHGYSVANVSRSGKGTQTAAGHTYAELHALCEGALAVINLAGSNLGKGRWTAERMREHVSSRIDTTRMVVDAIGACARKPILVQASASGFYGNTMTPTNEAMGHGNTFMAELCEEWEAEARKAQAFTRVAIMRCGVVLDPNEGALKQLLLPMKLFVGGPLGRGDQYFPWVHRDDAVEAYVWAASQDNAYGPYNVVAPQAVTFREFTKVLGKVLGRPSWWRVPELPLRLLIGKMADAVVDGQHLVPMRLMNAQFTFRFPRLREALEDLLRKS